MAIIIFFLGICATIDASSNDADAGGDPFSEGFNAPCRYAYQVGCEIGQQKYGEGAYDGAIGLFAAYLSYVQGMTAGFACALCESGFFGDNNKTQGNEKGAQCGNRGGDREAECCPNTGPQCGNASFQQAYNAVHPVSCKLGYDFGKGKFQQFSLIVVGAYFGALLCGTEGLFKCSSTVRSIGGGSVDQIPAEIAKTLDNLSALVSL